MKAIQNTEVEREALFTKLYLEAFPKVAAFISKQGGNLDQTKDIFQEALVIYYEQVVLEQKPVHTNAKAYLLGTVRNLWYGLNRTEHKNTSLDGEHYNIADSNKFHREETGSNKLIYLLETAGRKCMDMLMAFYYDQQPLDQIAKTFGFKSIRSATVQKYKCLEKVRDKVEEKELTYADLAE